MSARRPPGVPVAGRVPLERALSKLGLASRTQARAWILAGKMRVNGVVRKDPSYPVTPETARIEIEGEPALSAARGRTGRVVVLLHKPAGLVTTRVDEKGRPTVFSLVGGSSAIHLHSVGRLDLATSGLLLLTNDTRLSAWLTDPLNGVPRVYLVTARGRISDGLCRRLETGVEDEGQVLRADRVELRKASGRESHLTVTLREGKNREVRRMFGSLGHEVTRLKRVAFGGLELGSLAPGQSRELSAAELARAFPDWPGGATDRDEHDGGDGDKGPGKRG